MIEQWFSDFGMTSLHMRLIVILAIPVVWFLVSRLVLVPAIRRAEKTENIWDNALLNSIRRPLQSLIWVVGLGIVAEFFYHELPDERYADYAGVIRDVAVLVCISWFLNLFIDQVRQSIIESRQSKGETVDISLIESVSRLAKLAVFIIASLALLQYLGISIAGVLTFGGVGGIAIGFAARDLLANFFGGLMIYFDRPFSVGEWIESPDRDISGTVERIGWRITMIRRFDSQPLYVPNSIFSTISIKNGSRRVSRQIYETIGIRYDDAAVMDDIVTSVQAYLQNHEGIDSTQTPIVNFSRFAPSSLDFFIYCFTTTKSWAQFHVIKQEVLLDILKIIADHGAECAFPTSTMHIVQGSGSGEQDNVTNLANQTHQGGR